MTKRILLILSYLAALLMWSESDGFALSLSEDEGRELYKNHCARCHGDTGEGDGPAFTMQRPWPRDFTKGQYKFRSTPLNTLPLVEDVEKVIREGNLRTSMPPFKDFLSPEEIRALAEYVLNISVMHSGVPGGELEAFPSREDLDQVTPTKAQLASGQELFKVNCATCHGDDGRGLGTLSPYLYDENKFWVQTPDLTDALAYGGGALTSDIFMRLKTGIATSRMPVFDGVLEDEQIADISHYVRSIQVPSEERSLIPKETWNEKLPANVRGEYMVRAMSCALCHNHYDADGHYNPDMYLAGGVAITLPGLGVYYTKNLTSHPEDGLANWTEEEIVRTITTGYAPDRRLEAFSMPWVFFSHLEPEDAHDIAVYLKTLPSIQNKVPTRRVYPFHERLWTRIRQLFGFEYGRLEYPPYNAGDGEKGFYAEE